MGEEEPVEAKQGYDFAIEIRHADMEQTMQDAALRIVKEAFIKHYSMGSTSLTRDISTYVKQEYDSAYPNDGKATTGVFHCVCGRSFAASCTYETHYSIWFNVKCPDAFISVLLWRSKDNPYD